MKFSVSTSQDFVQCKPACSCWDVIGDVEVKKYDEYDEHTHLPDWQEQKQSSSRFKNLCVSTLISAASSSAEQTAFCFQITKTGNSFHVSV
jgi:hypothetical protein